MSDEFALISKYFASFSSQIGDDCALLELGEGEQLATSVDTLVENVHFYSDAPPDQVAYRAVVTALSDLAAMGAEPRAITLALTLPEANDTWLQQFSRGIEQAVNAYEVELIGGDTTRGPLTITVQVLGVVAAGSGITRSGAQVGDGVYVSGTPGDACAALAVMNGQWPGSGQYKEYLLSRFYRPTARVDLGRQLRGLASSAIDVSDGLLADAGHLCERSGVGIAIESGRVPLSAALQSVPDQQQALAWALSGGDDYELLFTVPADKADQVPNTCSRIGEVIAGDSVSCDVEVEQAGFDHFAHTTQNGSIPEQAVNAASSDVASSATQTRVNLLEPSGVELNSFKIQKLNPLRNFTHYLAFGFGSGLAPRAPGTFGTLAAIPLYLGMSQLQLPYYTLLSVLVCLLCIWLCDKTSKDLKVHDHPGIVWDEFAGFFITMWALPVSWATLVAGFVVFRVFDILKPWPISWLDKKVEGGFGIMIDDILAGVASCAVLHGALSFFADVLADYQLV